MDAPGTEICVAFKEKYTKLSIIFDREYPGENFPLFTPTMEDQYDGLAHIIGLSEEIVLMSFPRIHDIEGFNMIERYEHVYEFCGRDNSSEKLGFSTELETVLDEMIDIWKKWSEYTYPIY